MSDRPTTSTAEQKELIFRQAIQIAPPKPRLDFEPLEDYSFDDLIENPVEPSKQIIQELLPEGLTVIAGAQKMGKSWMALQMCMAVSSGAEFLGRTVEQGKALYLDLEGKKARMQARMQTLGVKHGEYPTFKIVHKSGKLSGGVLLQQLDFWLDNNPGAVLIVVDTAARVKGNPRRGEDAYQADSTIWGQLQNWALSKRIAVVLLHHFRKDRVGFASQDDWYERISGSLGLTGVCDCVMALDRKRDDETAFLRYSSRDFEEGELSVRFDAGRWYLVSSDGKEIRERLEYERNPVVIALRDMLKDSDSIEFRSAELLRDAIATHAGRSITQAEIDSISGQLEQRDGIFIQRIAWTNRKYRRILISHKH